MAPGTGNDTTTQGSITKMRIRTLILCLFAVIAVSAVASASASAAGCYKVAEAKTGNFEKQGVGVCEGGPVAGREFIEVEKLEKELKAGEYCAKVKEPKTGNYVTLKTCEEGKTRVAGSEFIRVLTDPTTQQEFVNKKGEGAVKTKFTFKSGVSTFEAGTNTVICQTDNNTNKEDTIVGRESVEKVKVTFNKCAGEETKTKEKCTVKSTTATGAEEIVTNELRGELGEVAPGEAPNTGVGLLLEPVKEPFVTLVGSCLSPKESAVEGALIGEVKPVNVLALTDEVKFEAPVSGTQKIKTIERSFAKHCTGVPVARECQEDAAVNATLKAFGSTKVSEATTDTNTFEEELEVRPGL
jgi:hypothetical protein